MTLNTPLLLLCSMLSAPATELAPSSPQAPPLRNFATAQAEDAPQCMAISSKWPAIIGRIETSLRAPERADFAAGRRRILTWLDAQKPQGCPPWPQALAIQRALLEEFDAVFDLFHAADAKPELVAGRDVAQISEAFRKLNEEACVRGSTQQEAAWRVFSADAQQADKAKRRQRFVINLQTDASVVQRDGSLAKPLGPLEDFTGLARTAVLASLDGRLDVLQGQGPGTQEAAGAYVDGAIAYAQQHGMHATVFVNAASAQVPSFARRVQLAAAKRDAIASYVAYDGWQDGALATPEDVAKFAEKLVVKSLEPAKKALLVVNCNAGLDRSGTLNAVSQLIANTRLDLAAGMPANEAIDRGFAAIPKIVWQIKQARPHAISSSGRYVFLHSCYAKYAETLRMN